MTETIKRPPGVIAYSYELGTSIDPVNMLPNRWSEPRVMYHMPPVQPHMIRNVVMLVDRNELVKAASLIMQATQLATDAIMKHGEVCMERDKLREQLAAVTTERTFPRTEGS